MTDQHHAETTESPAIADVMRDAVNHRTRAELQGDVERMREALRLALPILEEEYSQRSSCADDDELNGAYVTPVREAITAIRAALREVDHAG